MTGELPEAAGAEEEAEGSDHERKGSGPGRLAKRSRPLHSESDSDSGSDHPQQPRKRGALPACCFGARRPFGSKAHRWWSALSCPCTGGAVPVRPGSHTYTNWPSKGLLVVANRGNSSRGPTSGHLHGAEPQLLSGKQDLC